MTRFNLQHAGRQGATAHNATWLALLLASSCSLKSLDYLQDQEDGSATGGSANGGQTGADRGGTGAGGSPGDAGAPGSGGAFIEVSSGGAFSATSTSSLGGGSSTSATTTSTLAGAGGVGGASTPVAGGVPNSSELHAGGSSGSMTTFSSATAAGGFAIGGSTGNAGTSAGSTPSGMVYNVLSQSCTRTSPCPGAVSCCTQYDVPGGTFTMGTNTDPARNTDESPPHPATIDAFAMDRFEVTVGRFRSFVEAYDGTTPPLNSGMHPKIGGSGWRAEYDANMPSSKATLKSSVNCSTGGFQTWTDQPGVGENMPMTCVNWYLAFAFCIWDGGRLPTEAEWEMAAANGSERRKYPWGEDDANTAKHALINCGNDKKCGAEDVLTVGSYSDGANRWGHLDLAGNVWEWTLDYYDATYYQAIGSCDNCASLADSTPRVIRGGSFSSSVNALRSTARTSKTPITISPYQGFRCVRSP